MGNGAQFFFVANEKLDFCLLLLLLSVSTMVDAC